MLFYIFQAAALPKNASVEIEAVAIIGQVVDENLSSIRKWKKEAKNSKLRFNHSKCC